MKFVNGVLKPIGRLNDSFIRDNWSKNPEIRWKSNPGPLNTQPLCLSISHEEAQIYPLWSFSGFGRHTKSLVPRFSGRRIENFTFTQGHQFSVPTGLLRYRFSFGFVLKESFSERMSIKFGQVHR